jgi:beta-lactamase superfamily II metal-dependent hydrolase
MLKHRLQLFFGFLTIAVLVVWAGVFSHFKADTANSKDLKIYFLNVGQGDSEYIKMPDGEDVLIDGGPDNSVLTELGKVMNFGDHEINLVVLTHPHADHVTGLVQVLQRYKVDEIWESGVKYPSATYDAWKQEISRQDIKDDFVISGVQKNFDNISFKVLSPLFSLKNQNMDNVNNASVVTELDYDQFSTLFTGDLEKTAQPQIYDKLHAVTVLKVDHHGSNTGTTDDWLKILRPAIGVIEVGAGNTYGHPHQETLNLLKNYAVQIYRTDQNGTVEVDSDGTSWHVKPEKM